MSVNKFLIQRLKTGDIELLQTNLTGPLSRKKHNLTRTM